MTIKIKLALIFLLSIVENTFGQIEKIDNYTYFKKTTVELTTVNPDSIKMSDFDFLKRKIGNSKIVLLGEATHNDGSTTEAKTSIVKYLEKEMGFTVLAFETGFINAYYGNQMLKDKKVKLDSAKFCFMSGGWFFEDFSSKLFQDVRDNQSNLEIAGFDRAKPKYIHNLYKELLLRLERTYSIDEKLYSSELDSVLMGLNSFQGSQIIKRINQNMIDNQSYILRNFYSSIKAKEDSISNINNKTKEDILLLRCLIMDIELFGMELNGMATEQWNMVRDKYMADRILWLVNDLYPNQKIIIWAASGHNMKNAFFPYWDRKDDIRFLQMGDYLNYYFPNQVYSIAFTSLQGKRGFIRRKNNENNYEMDLPKSDEDSYEYYIGNKLGYKYGFTDLKQKGCPKKFKSNMYGGNETANWSQMFDALIFIKNNRPVTRE